MKKFLWTALLVIQWISPSWADVRSIIIVIGDGMGPEQVKAGALFVGGPGSLSFQNFPAQSKMTTFPDDGGITDSAASATAMATGTKVKNGVISKKIPGDGSDLQTLFEVAASKGWSTGLVTTADVTDATPAAFAAHARNRDERAEIAKQYLTQSKPAVIFGAGKYLSVNDARLAGYEVIQTRRELQLLGKTKTRVAGLFSKKEFFDWSARRLQQKVPDQPSLAEMTKGALQILEKNKKGFILLVENELIDEAGHSGELTERVRTKYLVNEVKELDDAVKVIYNWAKSDTLIIVTADHETGGLQLLGPSDKSGGVPHCEWTSTGHTDTPVSIYGWGTESDFVTTIHDNAALFGLKDLIQ